VSASSKTERETLFREWLELQDAQHEFRVRIARLDAQGALLRVKLEHCREQQNVIRDKLARLDMDMSGKMD
jgi:DNA anti-recombination protein RmuC